MRPPSPGSDVTSKLARHVGVLPGGRKLAETSTEVDTSGPAPTLRPPGSPPVRLLHLAPGMRAPNEDDRLARAGLLALLETIEAPTFIVREDGLVAFANAAGAARRALDPATFDAELRTGDAFSRTPLALHGWLLVSAPPADTTETRLERARRRFRLTPRQREVVELVVGGATNQTIAQLLGITAHTVEVHLTAIYDRAGVENRTSLVSLVLGAA